MRCSNADGTFAFTSALRAEKSCGPQPKSATRVSRGGGSDALVRGASRYGLSAGLASDCLDGIAFVFSARAAPDMPIESASALFTTLKPIGVTAAGCNLIWGKLNGEEPIDVGESAPLGPGRERLIEIQLRSLLQSHAGGFGFAEQPAAPLQRTRRVSAKERAPSSHLFDYSLAASECTDKLRSRVSEALDSVVDGINELELELESHERPARSCYTVLLALACLRPVCGAMTREALAVEWRINALVAAPQTASTMRELAALTPHVAERNRTGRCDFHCRLVVSFLASVAADVGMILFDTNWAGQLRIITNVTTFTANHSHKLSCLKQLTRSL